MHYGLKRGNKLLPMWNEVAGILPICSAIGPFLLAYPKLSRSVWLKPPKMLPFLYISELIPTLLGCEWVLILDE